MPQAIIAGIAAVTGTAVSAGVAFAVYAGFTVATIALSASQKRKAESKARQAFEASVVDRFENSRSTIGPRELVLGRARKGGSIFFDSTDTPNKAVLLRCIALAGHEIDGIERIYFNDTPIDLDVDGNVVTAPWGRIYTRTVTDTSADPTRTLDHTPVAGSIFVTPATNLPFPNITPGQESLPYTIDGNVLTITGADGQQFYTLTYQWVEFISTARVFAHLGSPNQAADSRLQQYLPGTWTAAHRARNVAWLLCEFVYEESSFPSGAVSVTAQIRGAKLYDPRTGLTAFSENPALMMRHIMLHPQFGKRPSLTAAEDARIIAAANACDTPISYWTGAPIVPMFRANGVFLFGADPRSVLDDLAQAMGGEWAYGRGEYSVRAGVYQAPVMALTEDDLAVVQRGPDGSVSQDPVTINPHKPRNEKINVVAARIWDEASNYVEVVLPPYRAESYIARDGMELSQEVKMATVFNAGQATHIAQIMLRDGRDALTVTLPFKMKAYPLEIFDGVTLTIPRYGWAAKEFRILGRTFNPAPDGCTVNLTLKETTAAIFQYGAAYLPGGYASNSGLPKPWEISPPVITDVQSGESELIVQTDGTIVNSVRVTWAPLADVSVLNGGFIDLQYLVLPLGDWVTITEQGDATQARILGLDDLAQIIIRVRSRNAVAVSDWSAQRVHRVVGKTEPPPNIENLSIAGSVLSWSLPRRVPDLAGYVFRFHYGNNLDWNSAAPLHTGVLTESPYDLITRPGGLVTIMGKALDTSGNMSRASGNIIMNLGDPPIANIIEEFDFRAMGWPSSRLYLPEDDYLLTDGLGNYLTDQDGNYLTTGFGPLIQTEQRGWTEIDGVLQADALDSFFGDDDQSFFGLDFDSFYEEGAYSQMVYVTSEITLSAALEGSVMTILHETQGVDLRIDYRKPGPGSLYGDDSQSFYGADADPFYGPPGPWQAWPGQLIAQNDSYQFRVTIGGGTTRGVISELKVIVDAPDIEETLDDVPIDIASTAIPYTKNFTNIKNIQATLQTNGSGAVTIEISKTIPLTPYIAAFDSSHIPVGGATADITIKGY